MVKKVNCESVSDAVLAEKLRRSAYHEREEERAIVEKEYAGKLWLADRGLAFLLSATSDRAYLGFFGDDGARFMNDGMLRDIELAELKQLLKGAPFDIRWPR